MRILTKWQSLTSLAIGIAALGAAPWQPAFALELKPFKDQLFAYPKVIESENKGRYTRVAYDKQRDIYKRDKIPLRKARHQYVNTRVSWSRKVRKYKSPNSTYRYFAVGKAKSRTRLAVIYVHGQGGNHRQGVNDWTFGGNFNRLQNLMVRNNGLLLTPEFTDFKDRGTADIATLLRDTAKRYPKARIVVACGSMGGGICWRLAKKKQTASLMSGMFILGSHWHDDFLKSHALQSNGAEIPIFFGHGSWDTVFKPEVQKQFFEKILQKKPNYPAKFIMFDTGKHGTPIRMVDWRRELNWMLARSH